MISWKVEWSIATYQAQWESRLWKWKGKSAADCNFIIESSKPFKLISVFADLRHGWLRESWVNRVFVGELSIELRSIFRIFTKLGYVRRVVFHWIESLVINIFEPWMIQNFFHPFFRAQSHLLIFMQKLRSFLSYLIDNILCLLTELNVRMLDWVWETHWEFRDNLIHCILISVVERRNSYYHLVDQYSHTPPVHRLVMSCSSNDLRSEVLRRSTKWLSEILLRYHFSESKISQT